MGRGLFALCTAMRWMARCSNARSASDAPLMAIRAKRTTAQPKAELHAEFRDANTIRRVGSPAFEVLTMKENQKFRPHTRAACASVSVSGRKVAGGARSLPTSGISPNKTNARHKTKDVATRQSRDRGERQAANRLPSTNPCGDGMANETAELPAKTRLRLTCYRTTHAGDAAPPPRGLHGPGMHALRWL